VINGHSWQRYEIVVRGRLSSRFAAALGPTSLVAHHGQTTLRADLVDQAQLYGLLNRLRDLGIELISVNPAAETEDAA
jgi:hypothetical protein